MNLRVTVTKYLDSCSKIKLHTPTATRIIKLHWTDSDISKDRRVSDIPSNDKSLLFFGGELLFILLLFFKGYLLFFVLFLFLFFPFSFLILFLFLFGFFGGFLGVSLVGGAQKFYVWIRWMKELIYNNQSKPSLLDFMKTLFACNKCSLFLNMYLFNPSTNATRGQFS